MRAMYYCLGVKIQIMGREFCANPIVLESSGIDIILEMGWLTKYNAIIHCTKKSVLLTSSEGEWLEFVATLPSTADCVENQLKADLIENIRVGVRTRTSSPMNCQVCHLNTTLNSS
jgi:hypothetical protein